MTHQTLIVAAASRNAATVYVAVELSMSSWVVGIVDPRTGKLSRHQLAAGDVDRLLQLTGKAKETSGIQRVVLCYEAGRDGHWLYRLLIAHGIEVLELDPASIQVNRRHRRAKSDGLDVEMLLRAVMAFERGEPRVCSVVAVPSAEEEDTRRISRERERLMQEQTSHTNRIKGLLAAQGVNHVQPLRRDFLAKLAEQRTGDGRPLPTRLMREITREMRRLALVQQGLAEITEEIEALAAMASPIGQIMKSLMRFKGIGPVFAAVLACECLYRAFKNRREVGSYSGLVPTPWRSGGIQREQGISKAGNQRLRTCMIELAWFWLRWQPESALSQWFRARVGALKGRMRRITIVAVARKLLVALWKFVTTGIVPEGAVLAA